MRYIVATGLTLLTASVALAAPAEEGSDHYLVWVDLRRVRWRHP